jgi:hypothetical protein
MDFSQAGGEIDFWILVKKIETLPQQKELEP